MQLVVQNQRVNNLSRKDAHKMQEQLEEQGLSQLSRLFDKLLLAELTSEGFWLDRVRRVIGRGEKQAFEMMGPYMKPLLNQMSVTDDCILVDNRLAVPVALRSAVRKRFHRGHPGQEAMLSLWNYLWLPHMHKNVVNVAEKCRVVHDTVRTLKMF